MLVAGRMAVIERMAVSGCVSIGIIIGTMAGLFRVGSRDAEWSLRLTAIQKAILAAVCGGNAICIMLMGEDSFLEVMLWSMFGGCLLAASVMDWWEQMVYRFVWWAAGTAAGMLLLLKWHDAALPAGGRYGGLGSLCSLMGFTALQELVFARCYGRADCHAFCVCALMLSVRGQGFAGYVFHMAIVFGGLTLVQLLRGNIARNGQLRKPVSLVPYIAVVFWLWVDFSAGKWYI